MPRLAGVTLDFTDFLFGLRYVGDFTDRFGYLMRADTSFGGSDGVWLIRAMATYDFGRQGGSQALFGYQLKSAQFDERGFEMDFSYRGVVAGLQFAF